MSQPACFFSISALMASALTLLPLGSAGLAQEVQVELPSLTFQGPPPLEVVEPGVQVVPGQPDEVFMFDGTYWDRHRGHWFRSRDFHGGWTLVPDRAVPQDLAHIPPGRYLQWHRAEAGHEVHAVDRAEAHHDEHREGERH